MSFFLVCPGGAYTLSLRKVTKVWACEARAAHRGLLANTNKKYVSPSKTQISLHLCPVLPESLSATVCEPRTQSFFSEDADQTSRTALSDLSLPRMHRSFYRVCLGLAVPWLIFERVLQMSSVSVSLINFMILQ